MSNQTTGTASGSAHEPSMDDILASIRRMIADDDVAPIEAAESVTPIAPIKTEIPAPTEPTALVSAVEVTPVEPEVSVDTPAVDDENSIFANFDDALDMDDDLVIPDALDADVDRLKADTDLAMDTDTELSAEEETEGELIDIDELIAEVEARASEDIEANLAAGTPTSQDTDIELVKSLMADLTDDTVDDEMSLEIHDAQVDAELSDILDEISDIQVSDDLAVEFDTESAATDDFNSLLQIAKDAKADANAAVLGTAAIAGGAAATAVAKSTPPEANVEEPVATEPLLTETAEVAPEPETFSNPIEAQPEQTLPEEIQDMTDAAEETIMGSEVEEATTSAFASLAKVVERKDDVVTSGPAIGDLVKEALNPMLKEWLDKNLKGIVERAVTKEIKRIANTK